MSATVPPPDLEWQRVRALFERAHALPAPERQACVEASGESNQVQSEVLSLLAHVTGGAQASGTFLRQPAAGLSAGVGPGWRLGAWALVEPLGTGGMGEVWLARRADGAYEGEAAVKLLKPGWASASVIERFAQERQALARLDHPHIARLFDAGLSDDGLPYFVMERVQGRAIDVACAELPLADRLQLFLQLADAVAHAHRHLLVHRDLKPGNVMVNTEGQVKLLDFGIAKALNPDPAVSGPGDAEFTQALLFTPSHASPEQVRGEPVSTATDVYSLGVLLYQLLTGQRPYGRGLSSPQAMAQAVLNEPPTRPSSLGADAGDTPRLPSRERLRGDLDKVLLKALEKEPERRYPSVEAFAADVRAYLAGYPVSARAPTWGYRAARFVARNRLAVGLAALALLALLGGLAGTLWQMRAAQLAQQHAEQRFAQLRQLSKQLVFSYHDQIAQLPGSIATREALLQDALRYLDGLAIDLDSALGRDPQFARELAESYSRIAALQGDAFSPSQERLQSALQNIDKAIALQPRYLAALARDAAALRIAGEMHQGRAQLLNRAGRLGDALASLQKARALNEQALALDPDDLESLSHWATVHARVGQLQGGNPFSPQLGELDAAAQSIRQAVQGYERLRRLQPERSEWMHQSAFGHQLQMNNALLRGDEALASQAAAQVLQLRDAAAAADPENANLRYQRALARSALSRAYSYLGQHELAVSLMAQGVSLLEAEQQRDAANQAAKRDLVLLRLGLARARWLAKPGDPAAIRALAEALAGFPPAEAVAGDFYLSRWRAEALLANARATSDPRQALVLAEQAEATLQATPDLPENASRRWALALALGQQAQALRNLGQAAASGERAQRAQALWRLGVVPAIYQAEAQAVPALANP
ncbi:protein kinase [Inhella sp.]|uniref:protein kinase domain-containing protein n=1 Tax=Inhella sp. TaxID=1921806 RepID=UPI0035B31C71